MIKIGITGNIASGKSCVEEFIKEAGYKVIDCDKINNELISSDTETINAVKKQFKYDDITDKNGNISKEKLGKIVFKDNNKKQQLEQIMHKQIKIELENIFLQNKEEKVIFISAALMFESGFYKDYDKIIFVYAPDNIRLKRLIKRNNYTKEYAQIRLNSQAPQDKKTEKSDFIIYNDSDLGNLKQQTLDILSKISTLF